MVDVSIIIPIFNGANWVDDCFNAVLTQDFEGSLEISVYNDSSTDNTSSILEKWQTLFLNEG